MWASVAAGADSAACAACHRAIYDAFKQTPMAATTGEAGHGVPAESFARAAFTHAASGFRYRVSRSGGAYIMEFEKTADGSLHGKKALAYFVGSGAAARSYLWEADGFLYEAPVAYYSTAAKWDLAPAYGQYAYPYLTRPIVPGCLNCHASVLSPTPGTLNRFAEPPLREGGVACERCHGPGEAHIERMRVGRATGGTAIVNPAKLPPDRRDSICAQCHLSGEVRVMRPGASWNSYRAGDRLADSVSVFVRAGVIPGMRVTSHFENLAQSACKRAAGDKLWCGSCHDPHSMPRAAERAGWFRRKCRTCHAENACAETVTKRARRQDDCIACHMPKAPVADAQHVVYTDHSIPRRRRAASGAPPAEAGLVPFGGASASPRDLALAYGIVAGRQGAAGQARALQLLEAAERTSKDDAELLLYLAEIYRNSGQAERAIPLYRRAMRLDPAQVTASVGLGGILFERGDDRGAIPLWQDALSKNSGLVLVGTNLAMAQWRAGDLRQAESTLRNVVALNPGFQAASDLLKRLQEALLHR
ncbi:MAG: tetratricopeptide repeat protein [Acidobacteriia bacterium]|nr:tetratricopeptide repeat protein [Terriglobia bacterium]